MTKYFNHPFENSLAIYKLEKGKVYFLASPLADLQERVYLRDIKVLQVLDVLYWKASSYAEEDLIDKSEDGTPLFFPATKETELLIIKLKLLGK